MLFNYSFHRFEFFLELCNEIGTLNYFLQNGLHIEMKKTILSLIISSALLSLPTIASDISPETFSDTMISMHEKISDRINSLREYASDDANVIIKENKRYILVNGLEYEINTNNYILFDFSIGALNDESTFRHVFNFIDADWELTWNDEGMIAVNKLFGNYDYGNGCLFEYAPNIASGSSNIKTETATCALEENEILKEISFLGKGKKLTFSTFGYEDENDFSPESVAMTAEKVYLGNARNAISRIDRYDLKTQQAQAPITGFTLQGVNETYRVISDITEHNERLYVASLSSNRVDIYDTKNNDTIIMSLGTGSWSGDTFDKTLTHPFSVAANDNYIFVADITGKISVYLQDDVTLENHKKTQKYAFLSLPESNNTGSNVKMEVVGQELIVNFDSSLTYVFDISNIEKSETLIEASNVYHRTQRRNVYESANGEVYTGSTSGVIDVFAPGTLAFTDTGVLTPSTHQFQAYYDPEIENEVSAKASWDLAVENNTLALLQERSLLLVDIETLRIHQSNDASNYQNNIDLTAQNVVRTPLLFNGESWESLTQNHEIKVAQLLSAKQDLETLNITSYAAQPTTDLTIEARFSDNSEWIKLGSVAQLEPFSSFSLENLLKDNQYYPTINGQQSVAIEGIKDITYLPSDFIDIRVTSKTDKFVQKISNFKTKWRLRFGTFNEGNWGKITPAYAREWMVMMTNFAYVMNSPEFEHIWFNFKDSYGLGETEFYGNAGPIDGPNGNFTPEDYQRVYNEFLNRGRIQLGVSTIGGGLGGGETLGVDTWNFYAHYYDNGINIIGHEFGHHWGSHSSSFSSYDYGLPWLTHDLHQMMIRNKTLPYLDDEINAFYKTPRDEIYNGVDPNLRLPRNEQNVNVMEAYFAENPLPLNR